MFEMTERAAALKQRLEAFTDTEIVPNEAQFFDESEQGGAWAVQPVIEELKVKARGLGLWNLFMLPGAHGDGAGLTNLDCAPLCEVVDWAIQMHGGTSNDFGLGVACANARLLRLADGPDEVHRNQIGRLELRRHAPKAEAPARPLAAE